MNDQGKIDNFRIKSILKTVMESSARKITFFFFFNFRQLKA